MHKKHIILVLLTFFITACVERGHQPKPHVNTSMIQAVTTQDIHPKEKIKRAQSKETIQAIDAVKSPQNVAPKSNKKIKINATEHTKTIEKKPFLKLSDETKNKISAFVVIAISILTLI